MFPGLAIQHPKNYQEHNSMPLLINLFGRPLADQTTKGSQSAARNHQIPLKAAVGIEPTNKGFAV